MGSKHQVNTTKILGCFWKNLKHFQKKQNLGGPFYVDENLVGWEFSTKITSYHRREIHTIAEEFKVVHCSNGDSRMHTRHIALYCSRAAMEEHTGEKQIKMQDTNAGQGKKAKAHSQDETVKRAVEKALHKAVATQQQHEKQQKAEREQMSEKATLQHLEQMKQKTLDGLRIALKNMRGLRGAEASASRAMYIRMIQEFTGEKTDRTMHETEERSTKTGSKKKEQHPRHESNSDTSEEEEEESESEEESEEESDEDDLSLITRKKRPAASGFAFSDSEEEDSDSSDDEEEDKTEDNKAKQEKALSKNNNQNQNKNNIHTKKPKNNVVFDEASFLAQAAKLAKAEALHQSKQTSSAVKNNTSRKQQHQHQKPEFILPPKRSEMKF